MQNSTPNIKFNYDYRDAGGNKKSGEVVFHNDVISAELQELESQILNYLFSGEFFYPCKLSIPLIHFSEWDTELDHDWYYFTELDFTDEMPTDDRTLEQFLADLKAFAKVPTL